MTNLGFVSLKPEDLTWERAFRLFSLRCKSRNLAETTQRLYNINLALWRRWIAFNGDFQPASTGPDLIRAYLHDMRQRHRKDTTIDCAFRVLRTFWRFLEREGLILQNPMAKVERPKREKRLLSTFSEEQFRLLLGAINTRSPFGKRDCAFIALLADTGLRLSEALSLKMQDIDFGQGILRVIGKGRKERIVPFGQAVHRALFNWIKVRGDIQGMDALWIGRLSGAIKKRNVEDRMKKYGQKAGIQDVRCSPHTLRHFFAITYLRNGGDVLTLQRILGHETLEMTRIYAQMADTDAIIRHRQASPLDKMGVLPGERRRVILK